MFKENKKLILQALLITSTSVLAWHWDNGWVLFWGFIGSCLIDE